MRLHGNLLTNILLHSEIDKAQVNMLIRLSEKLSYRQLCALAVFANKENLNLRTEAYPKQSPEISEKTASLLQEIYQLYSDGLLNTGGKAVLGCCIPKSVRPLFDIVFFSCLLINNSCSFLWHLSCICLYRGLKIIPVK